MTPQQLVATYFNDGSHQTPLDPMLATLEVNDRRGKKGLSPLCPSWLHKLFEERTRGTQS